MNQLASNAGRFAGKRAGRAVGSDQDGNSLTEDLAQAAIGGAISGLVSGAIGGSFIATAIPVAVKNCNSAIDNHESKILDKHVPNSTAQAAIKSGIGGIQANLAITSIPGNLIMGAVNGSLTTIENISGYKNAAIRNAESLLENIKTGNGIIDGVSSTIVNTITMPDRILSGTMDASAQSIQNVKQYAEKALSNAGTFLSDITNKVAQQFFDNRTNNQSTNMTSASTEAITNMFAQKFPSLDASVHNNFGNQVQSRYNTMIQNYAHQESMRTNQLVSSYQQHSSLCAQNVARNLYLYNLRQTTSWASTLYWNSNSSINTYSFNKPVSDWEIRRELSSGTSISLISMRHNVSSYVVESVARLMNGIVYGGKYYDTPYYVGSFGSLLTLTGLCSGMSDYGAMLSFLGKSGGIQCEVGIIPNLNLNTNHIFAIKSDILPFTDAELVELLCVLKEGIYDYESFPFYSLHFNNHGQLYPVMHEVFRGTLVGRVIEFLDYIMKGFANGDIYKDGFAEQWHKNPIHDVALLKQQLLKIKDIYRSMGKKYFSLREMLALYDLDKTPGVIDEINSVKGTLIQTVFRIIAYQKNIQQHESMFLLNPSFRVEHDIILPPAYENFLEKYKEENGQYPEDYRNLQIVYAQFAKTIEEMLPLLPQASKYFRMLGIINFFCYWFKTMQKMGFEPNFKNNNKINVTPQICALPMMPIRYSEKFLLTMTREEMFNTVLKIQKKLTDWLLDLGPNPANELKIVFKQFFEAQIGPKTSNPTIEDDNILPPIIEAITSHLRKSVQFHVEDIYKEFKIDNYVSTANPVKTLTEQKLKMIKNTEESKKNIEEEVKELFKCRTMMHDLERQKRLSVEQYINESLKPYTAAQQVSNAANIETFKKQNRDQCEKEILEMRIKFCHMLLFGEKNATDENIAKTKLNPIKMTQFNKFFSELTDSETFQQKLNKAYDPVNKRKIDIENVFKNVIDSLHNILKDLQAGAAKNKTDIIIKYKYLHSVVEIAEPTLLNSKGETIRIVGGCGMNLKNMAADHVPNGGGLFAKIKQSKIKELSFVPVDYLQERYYVFSLDSRMNLENNNSETKEEIKGREQLNIKQLAYSDDAKLIQDITKKRVFNRFGMLPIHEATHNGYCSLLKTMLQCDPSLLEIKTESGYTCLMIAAEQGKLECVSYLLSIGAAVDIVLYSGLFPLYLAIQNGFTDVALALLNSPKRGDINRKVDSHMTCLHLAIELNLVQVVKKLISLGADLTIRRKKDSFVPFHCAAANGNCEIIELMINDAQLKMLTPVYSEQALLNKGESPLHLAVKNGHFDAVKLLVSHPGCSLSCQNFNDETPLMVAILMGNEEIAKYLASKSTKKDIWCVNKTKNTALLIAGHKNMLSVGDILLSIDPSQMNDESIGLTYTYYLLVNGAYSRLYNLISSGKINYKQQIKGKSFLDIAAEFGHNLCVDYFLELGLKSNNLILPSIRSDNVSYVKEWIKTNAVTKKLVTLATESGSISVLKVLLPFMSDDDIYGKPQRKPQYEPPRDSRREPHRDSQRDPQPDPRRVREFFGEPRPLIERVREFFDVPQCEPQHDQWHKPQRELVGDHLLITAIESGSIECFKIVFKRCRFENMNNAIDADGNTLAHVAIKSGNLEMIKILFNAGYSFFQPNKNGINAYQLGYKTKKITNIFKSVDFEDSLIDAAVKAGDTKSIKHITSIQKIVKAASKYNQIYIIKWLQERDVLVDAEIKSLIDAKFELSTNIHFQNACSNKWNLINKYASDLELQWSKGDFIVTDWPLNIPINGQPVLHIIFSQVSIPSDKFMKTVCNANPEQKDKNGFPLIFKLLKGSNEILEVKDGDLFEQKLKLLAKYFPDKIDSLLTQTDDSGCDIFVILNKEKLQIVQQVTQGNNLIHAVSTNQINKITQLLESGANPYITDSEQNTPLHLAIRNKDVGNALLLIKYMSRFDLYNNAGLTPFTLASAFDMITITDALKHKANIYAVCPNGLSALHYAATKGKISAVKYLLSLGMPIDLGTQQNHNMSDFGMTPLYLASCCKQLEMYNFLRQRGANINVVTHKGNSIAIALIESNDQNLTEEVLTLPHFKDEHERHKMLWSAAINDNVFMLRMLYLDSVKMNISNEHNHNALDLACLYNSNAAVRYLINCGLNPSIDRKLIQDQTIISYLNNLPKIQPLLPEPKYYEQKQVEKIPATSIQSTTSYLTLEEKQLLIKLIGNLKLEYLAHRIKTEIGIRIFRKLFLINSNTTEEEFSNVLHLLLNIAHYQEIDVNVLNCRSYKILSDNLNLQYIAIINKTYPELPINELRAKFLTKSEFVQAPISEKQLDVLIEMYNQIIVVGKTLIGLTPIELKNKLVAKASIVDQIAIIRQAVFNSFRIIPHNTQILAVLSFIKNADNESKVDSIDIVKKIGQIRTGEGKSLILAIIALFYACNDKNVDIVTTSHILAMRDQEKYSKFYASLGITSSHICDPNPKNDNFCAQIVYGTISDIEFSILREKSFGTKSRYINGASRPFDVVIVDEVDNISLDSANNCSRISDESINDYDWIYKPYYDFATSNPFDVEIIKQYLAQYGNVDQIDDYKLKELYDSARRAKFFLTEDIHYIVRPNGKIVIIDYENTGTTMESCTWSFGVHQFLSIKHNVELKSEDITVASMSHYSLIKQYPIIIGLTGTSGGEQEQKELEDLYGIKFFDVPPHFPNKRVTLDPELYSNEQKHMEKIIESATQITQAGRPVLIITRTILDAMNFDKHFESTGLMYQIFTGKQITSEQNIIDKSGQAGMITIATNNAGRGTDIILSQEALKNGGLHVIISCYMKNIRSEMQGKGRSGRQGQVGSCQVIINLMDPFVTKLLDSMSPLVKLLFGSNIDLQMLREFDTTNCSIQRAKTVKHNHEIFKIFLIFSERFLGFRNMLDEMKLNDVKAQCKSITIPQHNQSNINHKLRNLINQLIKLQDNGTEQLWETFMTQLKAFYVQKIMQQWSDFFVRVERYENLNELFEQFMDKLVLNDNFVNAIFVNLSI